MQAFQHYYPWLIGAIFLIIFLIIVTKPIVRYIVNITTDNIMSRILSDNYTENVAELLPSLTRFSLLNLLEMSLRAESGEVIKRPLGSPKKFQSYDTLMFNPPQMTKFSLPENQPVDMKVTLGGNAEKPMTIEIPLMIAAMGYGVAMSEEAKFAFAKASKLLKTANCSGEGPFLPGEPEASGKFVLQICRWSWGARTDEQIAVSDMLEVQMGQGADVGAACFDAVELEGKAQKLAGIEPDAHLASYPAPPGVETPDDWPEFMKKLRQKASGIPIALKLMTTDRLEEELAFAVRLGFDAVMLDGTTGGSHATAPIKQDDFGIPSIYALVRAKQYLKNTGISLVISGGFFTPGQCLKALALGADAIYLGTLPLLALAHGQTQKVLPYEPPTNLVYYTSPDKDLLDLDKAATSVANLLCSMTLEMEEAMRALGKGSLKELAPDDLVALDPITAEFTGVKLVAKPTQQPESKLGAENFSKALADLSKSLELAHIVVQAMEQTITKLRAK